MGLQAADVIDKIFRTVMHDGFVSRGGTKGEILNDRIATSSTFSPAIP